MIRFALILALTTVMNVKGAASPFILPSDSEQCLVVTTSSWTDSSGRLAAFERNGSDAWQARGEVTPVRVGSAGLAWGRGLFNGDSLEGPQKIEGDKRAPAGVFRLLFAFGYQHSAPAIRLRYRPINPDTVTVDDPRSRYYNQMFETTGVRHPDWRSAEKMRLADDRYKWGIFVGHNIPPVPGAGSAIFLHVWKNSATTTVGCTAMPENALVALLRWLDPAKHPLLIQLPSPVYRRLETVEKLPKLSSARG